MKYLDLSLPTPEANLACDEALLDWAEGGGGEEVLRLWESPVVFVVVGYANHAAREANLPACQQRGVPLLRRCSGGGTVVQGPGCLNYSLVLRIDQAGPLASIPSTNRCIMEKHQRIFEKLLDTTVHVRGHTDLAVNERKFSGNAQRRKRQFLLFHGTFLLGFNLALVEGLLPQPSKAPTYRASRSHVEFLRNLPLDQDSVKEALRAAWHAHDPLNPWPSNAADELVRTKYSRPEWNQRF